MTKSKTTSTRPEDMQRIGWSLVLTGTVMTIGGIVLYCIACFTSEINADLSAILFNNADPMALAALVVMGGGTLAWIIGSFMHLAGLMEAEVEPEKVERKISPTKQPREEKQFKPAVGR